jgi:hypothetical protein
MTAKELSRIGIGDVSTTPRMFFVPYVGEVKIPIYYGMDDIFKLIYDKGYEDGVNKGKVLKQEEIRGVLGMTDI